MTQRSTAFLAHKGGDAVAVAVRDVGPGEESVGYLDGTAAETVEVLGDVPLGHKVALRDIAADADVIEYGVRIGIASAAIRRGEYIHVHNVRSARWQHSVA